MSEQQQEYHPLKLQLQQATLIQHQQNQREIQSPMNIDGEDFGVLGNKPQMLYQGNQSNFDMRDAMLSPGISKKYNTRSFVMTADKAASQKYNPRSSQADSQLDDDDISRSPYQIARVESSFQRVAKGEDGISLDHHSQGCDDQIDHVSFSTQQDGSSKEKPSVTMRNDYVNSMRGIASVQKIYQQNNRKGRKGSKGLPVIGKDMQKKADGLISPARTYEEFSPSRDYDNFQSYNNSVTRTLHKNSSTSIRKLRPPVAPLPKIKRGSHHHQDSSEKMPQVVNLNTQEQSDIPTWVSHQIKKHSKYISRIYQTNQTKQAKEKIMSPYLDTKKSKQVLQHATSNQILLPRFKKQPVSNLIGNDRQNPAEIYKEVTPVRTRHQTTGDQKVQKANMRQTLHQQQQMQQQHIQVEEQGSVGFDIEMAQKSRQIRKLSKRREIGNKQFSKVSLSQKRLQTRAQLVTENQQSVEKLSNLQQPQSFQTEVAVSSKPDIGKELQKDGSVSYFNQTQELVDRDFQKQQSQNTMSKVNSKKLMKFGKDSRKRSLNNVDSFLKLATTMRSTKNRSSTNHQLSLSTLKKNVIQNQFTGGKNGKTKQDNKTFQQSVKNYDKQNDAMHEVLNGIGKLDNLLSPQKKYTGLTQTQQQTQKKLSGEIQMSRDHSMTIQAQYRTEATEYQDYQESGLIRGPQTEDNHGLPKTKLKPGLKSPARKKSVPQNRIMRKKINSRTRLIIDASTTQPQANGISYQSRIHNRHQSLQPMASIDQQISQVLMQSTSLAGASQTTDDDKTSNLQDRFQTQALMSLTPAQKRQRKNSQNGIQDSGMMLQMQNQLVSIIDRDRERILQLEQRLREAQNSQMSSSVKHDYKSNNNSRRSSQQEDLQNQLNQQLKQIEQLQLQQKLQMAAQQLTYEQEGEVTILQQSSLEMTSQEFTLMPKTEQTLEPIMQLSLSYDVPPTEQVDDQLVTHRPGVGEKEVQETFGAQEQYSDSYINAPQKKDQTISSVDQMSRSYKPSQTTADQLQSTIVPRHQAEKIEVSDFTRNSAGKTPADAALQKPSQLQSSILIVASADQSPKVFQNKEMPITQESTQKIAQKEAVVVKIQSEQDSMLTEEPLSLIQPLERQSTPAQKLHPVPPVPIAVPVEAVIIEIERLKEQKLSPSKAIGTDAMISQEKVTHGNRDQKDSPISASYSTELRVSIHQNSDDSLGPFTMNSPGEPETAKTAATAKQEHTKQQQFEELESSMIELNEKETLESVAKEIQAAKDRKDKASLSTFRLKERLLLIQEIDTLKKKSLETEKKIVDQPVTATQNQKGMESKTLDIIHENQLEEQRDVPSSSQLSVINQQPDPIGEQNIEEKKQSAAIDFNISSSEEAKVTQSEQASSIVETEENRKITDENRPPSNEALVRKFTLEQECKKYSRTHGFTQAGYMLVKQHESTKQIVNQANKQLYNLRNSVQVFHIHKNNLKPLEGEKDLSSPKFKALIDFDSGDDMVEVIQHKHFYGKVLKDLQLKSIYQSSDDILKMDNFLLSIGALVRYNAAQVSTKVIKFEILRATWQAHGYEFSNLQKMRRLKGINFNMLNVKSIRILNRFAQKVAQFQDNYTKKMKAANLQKLTEKKVNMTFVVLLALLDAYIETITIGGHTFQVVPSHQFFDKLVSLKVRQSGATEVPNLTTFKTLEMISILWTYDFQYSKLLKLIL